MGFSSHSKSFKVIVADGSLILRTKKANTFREFVVYDTEQADVESPLGKHTTDGVFRLIRGHS